VEIADAARKHGIPDEDIVHAIRFCVRTIGQESGDRVLHIGASRTGRLLEIVVLDASNDDPPLVIHAMELRQHFYRFLSEG
jgi:hypothetical protein